MLSLPGYLPSRSEAHVEVIMTLRHLKDIRLSPTGPETNVEKSEINFSRVFLTPSFIL